MLENEKKNNIIEIYTKIWPVTTGYQLIRLGSDGDGGYLIPDCISGIDVCLSPGTCNDTVLEEDLARIYGVPCLLCDPAHDAPPGMNSLLRFDRMKLGPETQGDHTISINDWLKMHGHQDANAILLSMDIEGGEYELLLSMKEDDFAQIRIFCIELHYLPALFNESSFDKILAEVLRRISRHFDVVHMKPNNHVPFQVGNAMLHACIELTLLNKFMRRHAPIPIPPFGLPNILDSKNNPEKPWPDYEFYKLARFDRGRIAI